MFYCNVTVPSEHCTVVAGTPAFHINESFVIESHCSIVPSKVIVIRLAQLRNALVPMLVTLLVIVMLARLAQSRNAAAPILVTLSGMVMLSRLVQ